MAKTLYLIGPSNVGKSKTAERLGDAGSIAFIDLDERLRSLQPGKPLIHLAQNWWLVEPLLRSFEALNGAVPAIVAIGAGTQDRDRQMGDRKLEQWLRRRPDRVILIEGDQDELFKLNESTSRESFDLLEFGPRRQEIYAAAGQQVSFSGVPYDERIEVLKQVIETSAKMPDANERDD
jgi:hypothetical protein